MDKKLANESFACDTPYDVTHLTWFRLVEKKIAVFLFWSVYSSDLGWENLVQPETNNPFLTTKNKHWRQSRKTPGRIHLKLVTDAWQVAFE